MYGIPKGFDTTIFEERILDQVSYTANTISLSFDRDLSITLESSFEHLVNSEKADLDKGSVPVESSRLMQLAGASVVSARVEGATTLVIDFDNGQTFRCLDDSPHYESFHIHDGENETIV